MSLFHLLFFVGHATADITSPTVAPSLVKSALLVQLARLRHSHAILDIISQAANALNVPAILFALQIATRVG